MDNSLELLYTALEGATSQDPSVLKLAEQRLGYFETQTGFYNGLITIIGNRTLDDGARFIGAVYLKNGVEKCWRRPSGSIAPEEKVALRTNLPELTLTEPNHQILLQLSLIMAKISRLDVPKDWPDLFPFLLENIRSENGDRQFRSLHCTYSVIKILSTKRLTGDRKLFQNISLEIFSYLCNLWDSLYLIWCNTGSGLEKAHYCLKILRILTIRGFKVPHEIPGVCAFITKLMERVKEVLIRTKLEISALHPNALSPSLYQKHVLQMWKTISDLLETHPFSFVPFLQQALEFCAYFLFNEEGLSLGFDRCLIQGFNLLKGIILCPEYKITKAGESGYSSTDANPLSLQAAAIKEQFFNKTSLSAMVRILVTRFLPLTQQEIESWDEDPEEFALRMDDSGESWKYNLRQSAETLFVTLFKDYRKCSEILLSILTEFQSPLADPSNMEMVLAKDAVYNAAGIVAYELYDDLPFDDWLANVLINELRLPVPILHRRITWLVGHWTGVKINNESRPIIANLLLCGLRSNDVVVRLSSSAALRSYLDDFDFDPEQFSPFLNDCFHCLFALLKDVRESDNKMRVLHTMSFLIERMSAYMRSLDQVSSLTQYLPSLWHSEHNMLKTAVVSTSIQLVQALGTDSASLQEFLFVVLKTATDLNSAEHVYLLEEGLELWLALMEFAKDQDPSFTSLLPNLLPLITASTEYLKSSLQLVSAYCLLYPETFINTYGTTICKEFNDIMGDMKNEGIALILRTIETILRTSREKGPEAIMPVIGRILDAAMHANSSRDPPQIQSMFFCILIRLLLSNEAAFQEALQKCNADLGTIIDTLSSKVPHVAQPERKKLICIGLLKFLNLGGDIVYHRICGIFLAVVETLNDILKQDGKLVDSLCLVDFNTQPEEPPTPNDMRKRRLTSQDLVYSIDLLELFRNEVKSLEHKLGHGKFLELMSTVDVETMSMVRGYLE